MLRALKPVIVLVLLFATARDCPTVRVAVDGNFDSQRFVVQQGSSVTISWNVTNAEKVEFYVGDAAVGLEQVPEQGSRTVTPTHTDVYTVLGTKGGCKVNRLVKIVVQ